LRRKIITFFALIAAAGAAHAETWTGKASYYGLHGRTTSGQTVQGLTAAHRTLPFGSRLRVTNLANNRTVVVRVNDRGPFVRGRIVDVSVAAADVLGMRRAGVARVRVEPVAY
jgi:rare lipoprotein A